MNLPQDNIIGQSDVRAATDTPTDVELARRLTMLANPNFDADCTNSISPIVAKLLVWGCVAVAAWVALILRVQ